MSNEKERFKEWMGFAKFFLGTVILGLVASLISYHIQNREIEIKEMEQLGSYMEQAIDENLAVQKRFAEYFSTVTTSKKLRKRWDEYENIVDQKIRNEQEKLAEKEEEAKKEQQRINELENKLEEQQEIITRLENQKKQTSDTRLAKEIEKDINSKQEEKQVTFSEILNKEEKFAKIQSDLFKSKNQLTYTRRPFEVENLVKTGWVYLGQYNRGEKIWENAYFYFDKRIDPKVLVGQKIRVSAESINIRSGIPTPEGRFLGVTDVLNNGASVEITEIQEWRNTGYMWAHITY